MSNYKTTILQVSIHEEHCNPMLGEDNTLVSVYDLGGGPYIVIEQQAQDIEPGKVQMDYKEFMAVAEAAKMLMHQMYIEQAAQE
jgi:imidazoleglycerol phosphate dehydratase HisB